MSSDDGAKPPKVSPKTATTPTRSERLKAALGYAEAGIPVFPCRPGEKRPCYERGTLERGHKDATTNSERIKAWWEKWPKANVAMPTGMPSRIVVVDLDVHKDGAWTLEELEKNLGPLGDYMLVRSGSGGLQLWYVRPEGELRNGIPEDVLGPGVCIKADGGYVVVAPSVTSGPYEVLGGSPGPCSAWVEEALRDTEGVVVPKVPGVRASRRGASHGGGKPASLSRNVALTSVCGRLHNGQRDLPQLTAALMAERDRDYPGLPDHEVAKIARSIYKTEPCAPSRANQEDPEVEAILGAVSDRWYAEYLPKSGRSKKPDTLRHCIGSAAKRKEVRTVEIDGKEERVAVFSDSCRQIAEAVRTSAMSVSNHLRKLEEEGVLAVLERHPGLALTLGLRHEGAITLHPETTPAGLGEEPEVGEGVKKWRGPRADELTTPFYGWRSPWRDGGVEAVAEAFGPRSAEELAGTFGISRARDMRRRRLVPLGELGVLVEDGDRWGVPDDHAAAVERRMREPYTTVTRRRRRKTTDEGRVVTWVEEISTEASELERAAMRTAYHARERKEFRKMRRARLHRVAVECFGGVDPETGEIVAERREASEPTEEAAQGPGEAPEGSEAAHAAGDVLEDQERPQATPPVPVGIAVESSRRSGDDLTPLARALLDWLDLHPHHHPDRVPAGDRRMQLSWLESTLWAESKLPPGRRYGRAEVSGALSELELIGWEVAA